MDGTRVVFVFDDSNLELLHRITHEGRFSSLAATMHAALGVIGTLHDEAKAGSTQLIVRNPQADTQRTIELSQLSSVSNSN